MNTKPEIGRVSEDSICIVSYGGVFPDAKNPTQLFQNLLDKKISLRDLNKIKDPDFNHRMSDYYSADPKSQNMTSSVVGSYIARSWTKEFAAKLGVKYNELTTTQIVALEVADQVLGPVWDKVKNETIDIILGNTSVDTEGSLIKQQELIRESGKESHLIENKDKVPLIYYEVATSFLKSIKDKYKMKGLALLTDAACASSLSSIFAGVNRLRAKKSRFVLVGGIDLNFSPFLQVMFSKAGVLSTEVLRPFDMDARGMNPSEAGAFFLMTTVGNAQKFGLDIKAIINHCDGSSDGIKGGATEPTFDGQMLAYKRAHKEVPGKIHYIEAHGTGTIVGDKTEIESLQEFFNREVPVGAVKANIGHTIGAAGSSSLVKCLEIMKNRVIPPVVGFANFPPRVYTKLVPNKEAIKLPQDETINIALSSFGFGGTNFHMSLSSYNPKEVVAPASESVVKRNVYLVSEETILFKDLEKHLANSFLRIPPVTLPSLDRMILAGMLGMERVIGKNGFYFSEKNRMNIHVLSASALTLDLAASLAEDLRYEHLERCMNIKLPKPKKKTVPFNADTAAGMLNNLIAGRAAKAMDMRGVNFHIDADLGSRESAIELGHDILLKDDGAVFVLSAMEKFDTEKLEFIREGLRVELFATEEFINECNLPTLGKFKAVELT